MFLKDKYTLWTQFDKATFLRKFGRKPARSADTEDFFERAPVRVRRLHD